MKKKKPEENKRRKKRARLKLEDGNPRDVCGFRTFGGKRKELYVKNGG